MQQPLQNSNNKRGGKREGSGRKKKDVVSITITVPAEQLKKLDEKKIDNRSEAYATAMDEWINDVLAD